MTPHSLQLDNKNVSVDRFLLFWSQNNQTIVQVLIVVTLILIVILVFMTLFGSKEEVLERSGSTGISPDLEKSLQKMLENQMTAKSAVFDFSKSGETAPSPTAQAAVASGAPNAAVLAEVEKMKSEVSVRDRSIQELKAQLEAAQIEAQKATNSPSSSGLEQKVKELEARLAEYDIISEDIADLSRYKEENEKLKKQLAMGGGATAAPAVAPTAAVPKAAPAAAPAVAPATAPAPAPAPAPAETTVSPIDDDLMKEFAQAVESQKAQTAAPAPAAAASTQENEDLMGQFENFVQKKEGS